MMSTLSEDEWRPREAAHQLRVDAWVQPHLRRRSLGMSHPVEDFLFTYYSYRPAALRRWHPGLGVRLTGAGAASFAELKGYVVDCGKAGVDPQLSTSRGDTVRRVRQLLVATQSRPARLGCFGLHEWAMAYRQTPDQLRHSSYPLRLGTEGTDAVVESSRIICTHYDAFRFFTEPAQPLNALPLTRPSQVEQEQPGCLHATMDLYKWAYKLSPFTSAELVADCFALAREVRLVDMRAAPYDLSSLGIAPIPIETPEGKAEYVAGQRRFAATADPLRERLIAVCDRVLAAAGCASCGDGDACDRLARPVAAETS